MPVAVAHPSVAVTASDWISENFEFRTTFRIVLSWVNAAGATLRGVFYLFRVQAPVFTCMRIWIVAPFIRLGAITGQVLVLL